MALAESERKRGARREGSTTVMAELAAVWLDGGHGSGGAGRPSVPVKRERERSSERERRKGGLRAVDYRRPARPRPVNRRRLGSVPAATWSSNSEGLKWWVFSPPKLILLSKLIFKQNDVACLVRVARFVRNGK